MFQNRIQSISGKSPAQAVHLHRRTNWIVHTARFRELFDDLSAESMTLISTTSSTLKRRADPAPAGSDARRHGDVSKVDPDATTRGISFIRLLPSWAAVGR
jgi:hypothetical protein